MKRDPQPSAGLVDSQSVKTTGVGREQRGYDGGKKVKGRERRLLVDIQGLVLKAKIHSAKVQDRKGIEFLLDLAPEHLPRLPHLWIDAGYIGEGKGADWAEKVLGWTAVIARHPPKMTPEEINEEVGEGVGRRGRVDRSRGALRAAEIRGSSSAVDGRVDLFLALSGLKDEQGFERLAATSEALIYVAMTRLMVRRLARS